MSGRRYNPRRDANEPEIYNALVHVAGADNVRRVNMKDVCDLFVFFRGFHMLEVKTATGKASEGQMTFIEKCSENGVHAGIVRTPEEALAFIGATGG